MSREMLTRTKIAWKPIEKWQNNEVAPTRYQFDELSTTIEHNRLHSHDFPLDNFRYRQKLQLDPITRFTSTSTPIADSLSKGIYQ